MFCDCSSLFRFVLACTGLCAFSRDKLFLYCTFVKRINSINFQFDSEWAEQQEQEALDESEHRKKIQMWEAASRGDVEKVEKLAHMGVDINVANEVIG